VRRSDGTSSTYYATSDHLGSADLVLDGTVSSDIQFCAIRRHPLLRTPG